MIYKMLRTGIASRAFGLNPLLFEWYSFMSNSSGAYEGRHLLTISIFITCDARVKQKKNAVIHRVHTEKYPKKKPFLLYAELSKDIDRNAVPIGLNR